MRVLAYTDLPPAASYSYENALSGDPQIPNTSRPATELTCSKRQLPEHPIGLMTGIVPSLWEPLSMHRSSISFQFCSSASSRPSRQRLRGQPEGPLAQSSRQARVKKRAWRITEGPAKSDSGGHYNTGRLDEADTFSTTASKPRKYRDMLLNGRFGSATGN